MNKLINKLTECTNDWNYYKKKPLIVKATQMKENFIVKTLEGTMKGKAGDFIIQGIKGELYSCDKDIFIESYEEERK